MLSYAVLCCVQVDSPVTWSVEQVQQLQYSHLVHKVTEQQREWSNLYDKFVSEGLVNQTAPPSKQVRSEEAGSMQCYYPLHASNTAVALSTVASTTVRRIMNCGLISLPLPCAASACRSFSERCLWCAAEPSQALMLPAHSKTDSSWVAWSVC